jgi:hypothetical protein
MVFYNGFNLMVDLILCGVVGYFAYRFGFSDGFRNAEEENAPPF